MAIARPPIQLLTAFETAARLGGFKRAAEELHVTPSALSQAIQKLEEALGQQLFYRRTRRVELTDAGRSFHQLADEVLRTYASGFEEFSRAFERPVVRISMASFIAYEIVLPALHEFYREHPDVEIRIETGEHLVDLRTEPIDAAIRLGLGSWPGTRSWPLDALEGTLVCAPTLLEKRPIRTLSDLERHTLIVPRNTQDDWTRVASAIGVDKVPCRDQLVLDSYLGSMVAAEQGLGVAIALFPLMDSWVKNGRLVAPVAVRRKVPERHHFVVPGGRDGGSHVRALRRWVKKRFLALG